MTTEERRKLLKQLANQSSNEDKASKEALSIETPKEETKLYTVGSNDAETRRALLRQLAAGNGSNTNSKYSESVSNADQQWNAIKNIDDRKTLTSYYNAYMNDLQRAQEANDIVAYQRNRLILNRIGEKLGKQANVGTFMSDTASEIGGNIRLNIADAARNVEKVYLNVKPSKNLDAGVLYDIAKRENGTLKNVIDNFGWGKDEWRELVLLKEKYPNDKVVNDVYNTVAKQGFKGDKQYFEDTVKYINNLSKKDEYNNSTIVRNTQDEKNFMQTQKVQEELTYQEPIEEPDLKGAAKFALTGVGTASYMAPSIASAVVTGGAAEAFEGSKAAIQAASQFGSLFEMYNAAAGSAFDQTLNSGYDWDTSSLYSRLIGSLEVVTELIGGENVNAALFNHTFGKTALSPIMQKLIEKGSSDMARIMISIVTDVAGEAVEEMISAAIEPIIDYKILHKETSLKEIWSSILESATGSILPTLILGGYGKAQSISTVNKTETELLNMIRDYKAKGVNELFTSTELNEMEDAVKTWSNRAKAGIEEHYDEVKKQTENYEDIMNEIYGRLQGRPYVSINITDFAQGVQYLEPQEREQAIINYAKSQGIDEAKLRQMFGGYQDMFPYSYQQAGETINRWAQTPIAETQIQQPDKARLSKNVVNDYLKDNYKPGQVTPSTLVPPNDFNGTAYDWLKQYFKEENNNGISRLVLEADNPGIKDGSIYGTYDVSNVPTNKELNNSPIALDIEDIMNVENPSMGPGYYVYQNVNDALKDIENHFGTLEQFEYDGGGAYEILSLAGKGRYTLNLDFENPDNPTRTWLPPKSKGTPSNQPSQSNQPNQNNQPSQNNPPSQSNQPSQNKPAHAKSSTKFQDFVNKYGFGLTSTDKSSGVEYIKLDPTHAGKFEFSNAEYGPHGLGDSESTTQEELSKNPVALVSRGKGLGAKTTRGSNSLTSTYIFKNFSDAKKYIKAHKITLKYFKTKPSYYVVKSVANIGGYYISEEGKDGNYVWRSEFDGKRVDYENPPDESYLGNYASVFKSKMKRPGYGEDLIGKKFKDLDELAVLLQEFIDPLGETTRLIFANNLPNGEKEIVALEGERINEPGTSSGSGNRNTTYYNYVARVAKNRGADELYGMHNHPAHSTPSTDDKAFALSTDLSYQFRGLKFVGEIVEGTYDYSFIYPDDIDGKKGKSFKDKKYSNGYNGDKIFYKDDAQSKGIMKEAFFANDILDISKQLKEEPGMSKLVLVDYDSKGRAVHNISNDALLKKTPDEIWVILHDLTLDYGAATVGLVTDNADVYDRFGHIPLNRNGQKMKRNSKNHFRIVVGVDNYTDAKPDMSHMDFDGATDVGYGIAKNPPVISITPENQMVDDDQFWGRNAKPKAENKQPRHKLEKKQSSLLEEYNKRLKNETTKEDAKNDNTRDRYSLRPTNLEFQNTDIEQTISKIENGEMEAEVGRARRSLADMRRYINKTIMKGRMGILKGPLSRTAYGVWKASSHWIRNTQISDVATWFHELGHEINSTALNMEALNKAMDANPDIRTELNTLCEIAFGDRYNKKPNIKLSEGFAEGIRRFVENPEKFSRDFTNVANMFVNEAEANKNFADTMAKLKVLSEMVKDYENQPGDERLISNVDIYGEGDKPVYVENPLQRLSTRLVENLFNDMVYVAKVDRMRAKSKGIKYSKLLSTEKFEDNLRIMGNAQSINTQLGKGVYDNNGNKITMGLAEIMEEFLPTVEEAKEMDMSLKEARRKRMEDLIKYGVALREKTLIEAREDDLMLGTRENDIDYTLNKYKDDAKLQKAMEQINDNSKAFIQLAVDKGLIKKSTGEQILRDNVMYFPLNRVVDDKLTTTLGRSRDGSTGKSFYKLNGSDRQISNPIISLMTNWGRILYQVQHNDMLKMLVKFAKDTEEMGYFLDTGVAPKMSYRGQVSMDTFKEAFRAELRNSASNMNVDIPVDDIIDDMNFDEIYTLFVPETGDAGQRMMSYIDRGVRKTIQFANNELGNGLYTLLANLDAQKSDKFLKILSAINTPLKLTATAWNVEFALSNMQADAFQRFLYSNGAAFYIPVVTSMYNVAKYMNSRYADTLPWKPEKAGEMYEKFLRSGASQEGTFRGDQVWQRDHMEEVFGYAEDVLFGKKKITSFDDFRKRLKIKGANIGEKLNYVSEISEQATRFAEFVLVYNQMKAKGFDEQTSIREAGMKARQITQDFTVQGKLMRSINKVVPFASATIGSLYRFGQEARNHPARLSLKLSVLAAVSMMIEAMMDGDDREYYEEINKQKRFDNFFFKNPDDPQHPFIIKKPQGPARYFVNLAQLITNVSLGRVPEDKVEEEFYDWLLMSVKDQIPVTSATDLTPSLLQAMIENMINMDFYYGTPIVSKDLQKLDPRHQYDEYTSEVAKAIGNAFNWSPAQIDNIITTWFSGVGRQANNLINDFVRRNNENKAPTKDISEQLMKSKLFANAFRSSESINELYDRIEYLEREEAEGRITSDELIEYEKLKTAKSSLTQMNKQMKEVRENAKLSADQKAEQLNKLREKRIDVARYYLGKSVLNPSNQKDIELLGYYPANETYTYTYNKKKYEVKFDDRIQEEYAEEFQKEYEKELAKLKDTEAYKKSTEQEKLELEKKTKTSVRTSMTNKYKKIAYERQYKK